jgi:general secretion pathway protein D
MKNIHSLMLLAALSAASLLPAADAPTNAPGANPTAAPSAAPATSLVTNAPEATAPANAPAAAVADATNAVAAVAGTNAPAPATEEPPATNAPSATVFLPNGEVGLLMKFKNAPLEQVLDYFSEAAGFIIVLDTRVQGKVTVWSDTPMSKDEAVNTLNSVLKQNGYAAIRNERTLTIVNRDEVKTRNIRVVLGGNPDDIPQNDEIVTQIIPVNSVEAVALAKDLQPLVSQQATLVANESGNSIVVTDTQANIHRIAEIIKAIDTGANAVTMIKVFKLKHADPVEMASLLGSLFPDDSRSSGSQAPVQFGGGFGGGLRAMFGGGGRGGGQGGGGGGTNPRIRKTNRVIALADQRTQSVVVSASKDLIEEISGMIEQLDAGQEHTEQVAVMQFNNITPQEVQQVLTDMFNRNNSMRNNNTRNQQTDVLNNRLQQSSSTSGNNSSGFGNTGRGNSGLGGMGGLGN